MKKTIIIISLLLMAVHGFTTIIYIPVDYPTIQEGLNVAQEGDSVLVATGNYYENITWPAINGIKLYGSGEEECIIDGSSQERVICFGSDLYGIIDSSTLINGFTIQNGYSQNSGGGIYCYNSEPDLINLIIINNSAGSSGGGIMCHNYSNINFENVVVSNNSAYYDGGGICCNYTSNATLENIVIVDNETIFGGGGGISIEGGSNLNISNTLITGNSSVYGGGVYCGGKGECSITNCTIVNNFASDDGGGIYSSSYYSDPNLVNCILWEDTPNEVFGSVNINYSDIQNGWTGVGNIDSDPLFVDAINEDYHLTANSPCIDAGDPASPLDPDGTIADMGAYYYDQEVGINNYEYQIPNFQLQNYPNPFNPSTTISFELKTEDTDNIELIIYNLKGQQIRQYSVSNNQSSITWNGTDSKNHPVSSGVYFYQLIVDGKPIAEKKCLLLK